jgi:hypothetical protein
MARAALVLMLVVVLAACQRTEINGFPCWDVNEKGPMSTDNMDAIACPTP